MQQVLNRPIKNRGCLKKDRKINHAKSKPCGDMVVSIFDGQKNFMQIELMILSCKFEKHAYEC